MERSAIDSTKKKKKRMSKRPRADAEGRSAKDKTRHFLNIFRDPPGAEELVHSFLDRNHDFGHDGRFSRPYFFRKTTSEK